MIKLKITEVWLGVILAIVPAVNAAPSDLFLAGTRITAVDTRIPGNDLVPSPPTGPLAVIEPDTTEATTAIWKSAPLTDALVLLPGSVTLNLLEKNYSENPGLADICWSKRVRLPGQPEGTPGPLVVVAPNCFENTFPAMGSGSCPPSFISGQSPPAAGCTPQGLISNTEPSLILGPTVIPAGSVIELRIWCPGASFIGAFFNGPFEGKRSELIEPEAARVKEGRLTGGGTTSGTFKAAGTPVSLPVIVDVHQGLELHCDETQLPNTLEVNWDGGNHFHLDTLTSATCFDDPSKMPNPPPAGFDSYIGSGTGSCNGVSGATANWYFTDEGEPGTQDDASLTIQCADGSKLTVVGMDNLQGNFQAHGP